MSAFHSNEPVEIEILIQKILNEAAAAQKDLGSIKNLIEFITEEAGRQGRRYLDNLEDTQLRELHKSYQGRCNVYRSDHRVHTSISTGLHHRGRAASSYKHGVAIDGDSGYDDDLGASSPTILVDRSSNRPNHCFSEDAAFDVHLVPDPDKPAGAAIKTARYDGTSPESYIDEEEARGLCRYPVVRGQRLQVHWCIYYQNVGMRSGHTNCIIAEPLENVNIVFGADYNSREPELEPEPGPGSAVDDEEIAHDAEYQKGLYKHIVGMAKVLAESEQKSRSKRTLENSNQDRRKKQRT